ncbi:uncharacterized protein PGRI_007730 [Penicillium griseofulvum]|uniref:Uncharacterized protein n=1 Tax=Penicillium patulum TaxID=5078 RepID=A0A135LXN9_PENPA|nr:uncharacterized protein PGRI_007730 [Penicillium griseofulvum]KXG53723.1 hypothetical protein PGRI_007730 [Penicillium griseofulvum]
MSSPSSSKEKLFPGISATETKLLVLANVCLKNDKIDYDKLAQSAGIKASSAQTLFRNAKRKIDKMYGDGKAGADETAVQDDLSPEETPTKRGKSNAKAKTRTPKTPKSPKTPKTPKAPKTPKTPKGAKAAIKSESSPSVKSEVKHAEGISRETAVADSSAELSTDVAVESTATAESAEIKTKEQADEDASAVKTENDEAALDSAVNQKLPESPLSSVPDEEDDASYEEDLQEDDEED